MVTIGPADYYSPSTRFYGDGYVAGQSQSGNYSVIRLQSTVYNGPVGSGESRYLSTGGTSVSIDGWGISHYHGGNPFLPGGYAQNQLRWSDYTDHVVYHDSNGYLGPATVRLGIAYDGYNDSFYGTLYIPRIAKAPGAPSGLSVTAQGVDSFGVTYTRGNDNGAGLDADQALWATDAGFSNVVWTDGNGPGTSGPGGYTNPSGASPRFYLQPNTQYWVKVRSHNSQGWGPYSSAVSGTTLGHPGAPTGVSGSPSTTVTGRIALSWTAPSVTGTGGIVGYNIFRDGVQIGTTTGTGTTYTDNGRTKFTSYTYKVAARNNYSTSVSGMGPQSAGTAVVAQGSPSAPINLTGASDPFLPGKVDLSWSPPANVGTGGITGYRIRLADGTLIANQSGAGTTYSATGLTPGLTYTFKVSGRNDLSDAEGSEGTFSNQVVVTPVGEPTAPTGVFVAPAAAVSNRLVISWTPPSGGLSGYSIFRRISGADTLIGKINATHTSFTVDDLAAGSAYTYVVRARTVYTDTLGDGYPGNWGGPASAPATGTATNNNVQNVPNLDVANSGTNAIFNGTYTINSVTANTIRYAKVAADIVSSASGGSIVNLTNSVFNGTFTIATPTSNTITYAKTNSNILTLPSAGGVVTDLTNQVFNGTYTVSSVNVGANLISYAKTAANIASAAVPNNSAPGKFGIVTNLSNAIFNGTGKTILAATANTLTYAQTHANVAESNAAGAVINITNRDTFNGIYEIYSIPGYNVVKYLRVSPTITTRTWELPNGLVYRVTSPSELNVRFRSGWAG